MDRREAEDRRAGEEGAGEKHDPDHRTARRGRVRHGVEADHDMRQAGKPEHIAQSERDLVEWVLQKVARQQEVRSGLCLRRGKQDQRIETHSRQHEK